MFGKFIKHLMGEYNIVSMAQLARMSGILASTVRHYVRGTKPYQNPKFDKIRKYARGFNMTT